MIPKPMGGKIGRAVEHFVALRTPVLHMHDHWTPEHLLSTKYIFQHIQQLFHLCWVNDNNNDYYLNLLLSSSGQ